VHGIDDASRERECQPPVVAVPLSQAECFGKLDAHLAVEVTPRVKRPIEDAEAFSILDGIALAT
jgi:hypothetical protein